MEYQIKAVNQSLIITLYNINVDLKVIFNSIDLHFDYLILDLSNFKGISQDKLENFVKFGVNIVSKDSFLIVYSMQFCEDFIVVPTMSEAFDIIEIEEIKKQL